MLVSSCATITVVKVKPNVETDKRLIEVVNGWGDEDKQLAGLAAIRIKNGQIAYEFYSGEHNEMDREGIQQPTKHSLYRIASISKFVTSLAAMKLVEEGKLNLDEDASDYLGFTLRNPHFPNVIITSRMLLSNTSSIVDGEFYSAPLPYTISDFFTSDGEFWQDGARFLSAEKMNSLMPGEFFYYANINFGLMGSIIENISGERFDMFAKEKILDPLEIRGSFNVRSLDTESLKNLNPIYRLNGGQWKAQVDDYSDKPPKAEFSVESPDSDKNKGNVTFTLDDYKIGSNGTLFSPQGGLRTSARGLSSICKMMLNRGMHKPDEDNGIRIFSSEIIDHMENPQWQFDGVKSGNTYDGFMQSYGLGVHHLLGNTLSYGSDVPFQTYDGGLMGHAGDAYGLLSGMYYDPDKQDCFIYLLSGTPKHEDNYGEYSTFYRWEEAILTILNEI